MSEHKFNCPACGQKISGDSSDAGRAIACPACQVTFVIPPSATSAPANQSVPAPAPRPAAPVAPSRPLSPPDRARASGAVTQTRPNYCGLAQASLISSVVVGIGWLPGIICGHLAKARIRRNPLLDGDQFATAGLIISYVMLFVTLGASTGVAMYLRRWQPVVVVRNSPAALGDLARRIVDEVQVADTASETAHGMANRTPNTTHPTGYDTTNRWRGAQSRNAFAYLMQVLPDQPMTLNCRFCDDGNQRLFDIIVNDQLVGGEVFQFNVPGHLYDVEYRIPESVTHGQKEVTVTFRSQNAPVMGKLFACQILKP